MNKNVLSYKKKINLFKNHATKNQLKTIKINTWQINQVIELLTLIKSKTTLLNQQSKQTITKIKLNLF